MFSYHFAQNALIGVLLITPLLGLLSTVVVSNKMAFFADGLSHSAFTGIAIGVIFNLPFPTMSLVIFSLFFAVLMVFLKQKNNISYDTAIGVCSSTAIALGLVLLTKGGNNLSKYTNFLVGDLYAISEGEILTLAIVFVFTIICFCILFNSLVLGSLGNSWTLRKQIKAPFAELVFTLLLAVITALSIQWVGILLINSLLVLPAATARLIAKNSSQYVFGSVFLAIIAGVLGLTLSLYWNTASGASIVLILAFFYFVFTLFQKK